jgi:endogenous inhibitor of DNA gyrase (YacG/DUF329 family)
MNSETRVNCPTCGAPVAWTPQAQWRPFCSERCRLLDLGAWFTEERGIPGDETDAVGDEPSGPGVAAD